MLRDRLKLVWSFTLLLLIAAAPWRSTQAAAFDCAKAGSRVEHLICDTPTLSALDDQLAAAFRRASGGGAAPELRDQQRAWLKQRNRCGDAACVAASYRSRLERLAAMGASAGTAGGGEPDGKFCLTGPGSAYSLLMARAAPGNRLRFALTSWTAEADNFSVAGTAEPTASGWLYQTGMASADAAEHCMVALDRSPDGGLRVTTREGARCEADAGHNAVLYGSLAFAASSRVADAPAHFDIQTLQHVDCGAGRPG